MEMIPPLTIGEGPVVHVLAIYFKIALSSDQPTSEVTRYLKAVTKFCDLSSRMKDRAVASGYRFGDLVGLSIPLRTGEIEVLDKEETARLVKEQSN
jgi:hypothetical protein